MARTNTLGNFLTDVADAIRTKKGSEELIAAADFDTEIENLPSGGETQEAPDNDVIFYDYDGTKLLSYTAEEFLALEEMPSLPATVNHPGLIPQGWNWSFNNAQNYVEENGALDVAQIYNADVSLRVFVEIDEAHKTPYLGLVLGGTATIDWGDGTEPQEVQSDGSNRVDTQHIYQNSGSYVISVTSEYPVSITGVTFYGQKLFTIKPDVNDASTNTGYGMCVKKIEMGNKTSIGNGGCWNLYNLETINIPSTYSGDLIDFGFQNCSSLKFIAMPIRDSLFASGLRAGLNQSCFSSCTSLKAISLPYGWSYINSFSNGLNGCTRLKRIIIPNTIDSTSGLGYFSGNRSIKSVIIPKNFYKNNGSITTTNFTINSSMFSANSSLLKLFIPKKVNNIQVSAFSNCVSCQYYDFSEHTSVPTLANKNAFTGIPDDCKIIVPDDLYESWIAATNWSDSTIVDHIISKSDWDALQNA